MIQMGSGLFALVVFSMCALVHLARSLPGPGTCDYEMDVVDGITLIRFGTGDRRLVSRREQISSVIVNHDISLLAWDDNIVLALQSAEDVPGGSAWWVIERDSLRVSGPLAESDAAVQYPGLHVGACATPNCYSASTWSCGAHARSLRR